LLILVIACPQPQIVAETQTPDIPRYTADQVIYAAKEFSPGTYHQYRCADLAWQVQYLGKQTWKVEKFCIDVYGKNTGRLEVWYFHEQTGHFYHEAG